MSLCLDTASSVEVIIFNLRRYLVSIHRLGGKVLQFSKKRWIPWVHISHLDIPKKGKPCFFPPGPWCRGWTRNMEFPNGVPLVSLGKARVTVDASTPPPPYRWCPEPGAWWCKFGGARFGASLSLGIWKPQKTPWKIGGKHVENIRILILRHMVKIGRSHFRV